MSWAVHLSVIRRRLWAPAGIWAIFIVLIVLFHRDQRLLFNLVRGYVTLLPALVALVTPALFLDDPPLELILTVPRRPMTWLLQRVAALFLLSAGSVLALWGLASALSAQPLVPAWVTLVPSLSLSFLALAMGLAAHEAMVGATAAGILWFLDVIAHSALSAHPVWRYMDLSLGVSVRPGSLLLAQHATLAGMGLLLLLASAWLIRREERYL
ncbi:MAG: hypothetical protein ACM3ZA_10745 [Bacillota bacterium]